MENQNLILDPASIARLIAIETRMKHQAKLKYARDKRYREAHPEFKEHFKIYKRAYDQKKRDEKAAAKAAASVN